MKTRHVIAIVGALVAVAPPAAAQGYGYGGASAYPTFPGSSYSPRRENERRWQESERERQRMQQDMQRAQRNYNNSLGGSAFDPPPRRRY